MKMSGAQPGSQGSRAPLLQPPHSHITWDLQVATAQWGEGGGGKTTRRREPENNQVSRDPAVGGGLQ